MVTIERRALPLTAAGCATAVLLTAAACGSTVTQAGATGGASASSSATTTPVAPTTSAPITTAPATPPKTTAPAPSSTATPICHAGDMTGVWHPVPGSSGAGQTSSDLAFQNTSGHKCSVSGFPKFTLYAANHNPLPTNTTDFKPVTVMFLAVAPGGWVHSELRYSADIPGPGEPQTGPCEPSASYALVLLPGDTSTVKAPLTTPTPVCEMGAVQMKPFAPGSSSPAGG
jgi:hypothetical protein